MDSVPTARQAATDLKFTATPGFQRNSKESRRKTSQGTPNPLDLGEQSSDRAGQSMETLDDLDLNDHHNDSGEDADDEWNTVENMTVLGLSFGEDSLDHIPSDGTSVKARFSLEDPGFIPADTAVHGQRHQHFDKWMKSLHRKATHRRKTVTREDGGSETELLSPILRDKEIFGHKKSSSGSSFGFVTAVKSASISLASFSVAPQSRRHGNSFSKTRTDCSSRTSNRGARLSEDSSYLSRGAADDIGVTHRSIQRRRVLEEIIDTEEGYVADIKFLMNVYSTLLASIPTLSFSLRSSINRNLTDIVDLHEELLGDLHRAVPHSEYTQADCTPLTSAKPMPRHQRWRSLDAVPEQVADLSWLQKVPGLVAEPNVAAEVAKVFGEKARIPDRDHWCG
ncbi:MAG: hypothetical protein M1818_008150 [Claussenomyces sp. TS43310]|nr:MAG: hypothetical protein M1818_008150 [Claussenomyces sp. TS43310]